ncbi:hypothetical protein FSP39_003849 [Pinctada imbricata]|uniref:Uncharacterized protein n=1 Tax=Pinctada imbricata TaxID=66713 RepID=A0AA89C2H0_PINIB|nr:hypothetical protein FSP39_003849 [Pinctada imbricata]
MIELSSLNTLMYHTNMVALDCPAGQRMVKGCSFCVMQLPCRCSITSGDLYLPPKIGTCANNSDSITILHPVNLALIQEFFDTGYETIEGHTTFQKFVDLKIPTFKIFNHSFSKYLAADKQDHLSLKKMADRAKKDEKVFQTLAESMIDGYVDLDLNSFPDTSGTIAISAACLAVICFIYSIWSYLKFRKLTAILALTHQINQSHAFPTPQPDLSFIYTQKPGAPSQTHTEILEHVYTSFTTPWPYVTLSVITTLMICCYAHKLWRKFKRTHKTTLHIELTTGTDCILIELASLPLCPEHWLITPPEDIHAITINRTCLLWANLTIDTSDFIIRNIHTDKQLKIPMTIHISPFKALRLRNLLRQPYTAYFLLSHHQYFKLLQ